VPGFRTVHIHNREVSGAPPRLDEQRPVYSTRMLVGVTSHPSFLRLSTGHRRHCRTIRYHLYIMRTKSHNANLVKDHCDARLHTSRAGFCFSQSLPPPRRRHTVVVYLELSWISERLRATGLVWPGDLTAVPLNDRRPCISRCRYGLSLVSGRSKRMRAERTRRFSTSSLTEAVV
jgi:hypothetical protein